MFKKLLLTTVLFLMVPVVSHADVEPQPLGQGIATQDYGTFGNAIRDGYMRSHNRNNPIIGNDEEDIYEQAPKPGTYDVNQNANSTSLDRTPSVTMDAQTRQQRELHPWLKDPKADILTMPEVVNMCVYNGRTYEEGMVIDRTDDDLFSKAQYFQCMSLADKAQYEADAPFREELEIYHNELDAYKEGMKTYYAKYRKWVAKQKGEKPIKPSIPERPKNVAPKVINSVEPAENIRLHRTFVWTYVGAHLKRKYEDTVG